MTKRVGVLGGTFDPVHKGHLAIARSFLDSGEIDELWIIPSAFPPHKNGDEVTSYADRRAMLELVFDRWEKVRISTIEDQLPKPSYTLQTIRSLKEKYPEYQFYLCMGSDSLVHFHQWHRYREILGECSLLVAKRPGFDDQQISPEILNRTQFVAHKPIQISSSGLKDQIKGEVLPEKDLPDEVVRYIKEKGLYL